jgi:Zn-dependent metalloprotease
MRPLLLAVLAACREAPAPPIDLTPLAQLERDTGVTWRVRYQPDLPTAAFLEGRTAPMARTGPEGERAGRSFLRRYGGLFGEPDELDTDWAVSDELGMTHVSFHQRQGKIPVWGGELRVHFARDGALVRVNGRAWPLPAISPIPVRSAEDARLTALLDAQTLRPELDRAAFEALAPQLWIHPRPDGARLAWRVEIHIGDGKRPMFLETFVDAEDGSIRTRSDRLRSLAGSGVGVFGDDQPLSITESNGQFWLIDATRGSAPENKTFSTSGRAHLPGTGVHSPVPNRWDLAGDASGAAVDAHAFVARTWDYFLSVHGRAGWDGRGHGFHTTVHFGEHYAGAFFDGRQLVFGDGNQWLSPPAAALDVVAHEYTHGVIQGTAALSPEGESGALCEAIADLFACFVTDDWLIGETIYHPLIGPRPLRDLREPHTMADWDDRAGSHQNSLIASHAGWRMSQSLGMEAAARIWYRALTRYLTSEARLLDAADATVAAAADFGNSEEELVRAAWIAVGVE